MIGPTSQIRSFQSSAAYAAAGLRRQSAPATAKHAIGTGRMRYQYATKRFETRMRSRVWVGSSRPMPSMNETSWGTRCIMRKQTTRMTTTPATAG